MKRGKRTSPVAIEVALGFAKIMSDVEICSPLTALQSVLDRGSARILDV